MRARADAASRTRQEIVWRAAKRLRRSPEPVTLVEIAAAAACHARTVYRHFRSITGLLDAVAADLLSRARFDQLLAAASLPEPAAAPAEVTRLGCGIWALDPNLVRNLVALARVQADALPVIDHLRSAECRSWNAWSSVSMTPAWAQRPASRRDAVDLLVAATGFAGWDQIVTARRRSPATATKLIVCMALRAVTWHISSGVALPEEREHGTRSAAICSPASGPVPRVSPVKAEKSRRVTTACGKRSLHQCRSLPKRFGRLTRQMMTG